MTFENEIKKHSFIQSRTKKIKILENEFIKKFKTFLKNNKTLLKENSEDVK